MSELRPIRHHDGYLPIEDHGLIGDGRGSALVGRDGAITWMCVPRFDSPPVFCGLLDRVRGGEFRIDLDATETSRRRYLDDTGVLVTELHGRDGAIELTDAFLLRKDAKLERDYPAHVGTLVRGVRVLTGPVRVRVVIRPRGRFQHSRPSTDRTLRFSCYEAGDLAFTVESSRPLSGTDSTIELGSGERMWVSLRWDPGRLHGDPESAISDTVGVWRRWASRIAYEGPNRDQVRRSAITLKLLDHLENGAIVASPTSSLPELIKGQRNWDYRYTWVRDAALSMFALRRIGLLIDAGDFLRWVLDAVERDGRPRVMYDLDGKQPPAEYEDFRLEGYRRSAPVRWGNAASAQIQRDAYGEILDCAFQFAATGGRIEPSLWKCLVDLVETAGNTWSEPDQGIWEIRAPGRQFTYSAALCQVALDRAARMARRLDLPGDIDRWKSNAATIAATIRERAWDETQQAFTQHLGEGGGLDASLLALPLRRVIPADDPRMVATTKAIADRLGTGKGLLRRYEPERSPDGLPGREGAFVLASFWLVDNLVGQKRIDEAGELFDSLCSRTNELGLLAEEIDPDSGGFLGNFPQGLSHIGLIASGVNLDRVLGGGHPELSTQAWFTG